MSVSAKTMARILRWIIWGFGAFALQNITKHKTKQGSEYISYRGGRGVLCPHAVLPDLVVRA